MSRRDGSKRRRGVTAAPFYLGSKAAGNYEADFAVFPQPSVRHLLRQERVGTVSSLFFWWEEATFECLPFSLRFTGILLHTFFWASQKIGGFHFLIGVFI